MHAQEALKAAVWHAPAGTGEVQRIISEAPFKPGVRGFTSLLQLCSRDRTPKAWQKVRAALLLRCDPFRISSDVDSGPWLFWQQRPELTDKFTCRP